MPALSRVPSLAWCVAIMVRLMGLSVEAMPNAASTSRGISTLRKQKKEGTPPLLKSVNRQLLLNHPKCQYSTLGIGKVQQVYASREIAHWQQQLIASIMGLASYDLPQCIHHP